MRARSSARSSSALSALAALFALAALACGGENEPASSDEAAPTASDAPTEESAEGEANAPAAREGEANEPAEAQAPRVLIVLTSHGTLGDTGRETGFYLSELTHVYYPLREAGVEVRLATIEGGEAPMDGVSADDPSNARFLDDADAREALREAPALADMDVSTFDAIYFPGGHGTMWDLPANRDVAAAITTVVQADGTVAAVCHGPAAFVGAVDAEGEPLVQGRRLAAFSDEEERARDLEEVVPFLLESRLRELGAELDPAPPFEARVVEDGPLLTGQNPASARELADRLLRRLGVAPAAAPEAPADTSS